MSNFILSCCSTADLSKDHFIKRNINYVPFHFYVNGEQYYDDLGQTIPFEKFYEMMKQGADVKTSQVNQSEFINHFTPFLESGKDILHISLSSGISGAYNSALMAKAELEKTFPERKIYIVDSLAAASGYGLIMDKLADLRDSGKNLDEIYQWIEKNKLKLHHWFTSMDLTFYVKGGRLSKTAGFFGGLFNICPICNMNSEGKLTPMLKVRSKQKAFVEMVNKMVEYAEKGLDYSEKCFISHSNCYEDALTLAHLVEEKFKKLPEPITINSIGTTIGSHSGPGTVSLFFWGKER